MRFITLVLALTVGFSAPLFAQDDENKEVNEGNMLLNRLSFGGGAFFGEEDETFDRNSFFGAVHAALYDYPKVEGRSGVGIELSYPSAGFAFSLWNLNRVDVPGIPGMYGGGDMKFGDYTSDGGFNRPPGMDSVCPGLPGCDQFEDNSGYSSDFDFRVVVGYRLGNIGSRELRLEVYTLEESKPIAFAFIYGK